ncbi:MAG: GNAT family N-acetyltransferase [Nitriliruptor sp.]|nr:MAG: GNAT family N-acetyltransferase [Nitriliruptor sp.]
MQMAHALGRWVIFSRALSPDAALPSLAEPGTSEVTIGPLERRDLDRLAASGRKGREDAAILESADVAVVGRDGHGEVVHFRCIALASFTHPGLPFPIRVDEGEAFSYHVETARSARGRGLARRGLAAILHELQHRGIRRIEAHTTERNGTVRRYYGEAGFDEVGWLFTTTYGSTVHWITAAQRPFFEGAPLHASDGLHVHAERDAEVARLARELDDQIVVLRQEGARVALLGSGAAADELLLLVPSLRPLVVGVADSDVRRQGATFGVTGDRIVAPEGWTATGATHLLYASKAYQDEMHDQHLAFGPPGSRGIRIHPRVEVVAV